MACTCTVGHVKGTYGTQGVCWKEHGYGAFGQDGISYVDKAHGNLETGACD